MVRRGIWLLVALALGATGCSVLVDSMLDPGGDEPDAGPPDAGTPDTGMPDSGMPDSGTPDTGMPDGGGGCLPPAENGCGDGLPLCEDSPEGVALRAFALELGFSDAVPIGPVGIDRGLPPDLTPVGARHPQAVRMGRSPAFVFQADLVAESDPTMTVYRRMLFVEPRLEGGGYQGLDVFFAPEPLDCDSLPTGCDVVRLAAVRPGTLGGRYDVLGQALTLGTEVWAWNDAVAAPFTSGVPVADFVPAASARLLTYAASWSADGLDPAPAWELRLTPNPGPSDPEPDPADTWFQYTFLRDGPVADLEADGCGVLATHASSLEGIYEAELLWVRDGWCEGRTAPSDWQSIDPPPGWYFAAGSDLLRLPGVATIFVAAINVTQGAGASGGTFLQVRRCTAGPAGCEDVVAETVVGGMPATGYEWELPGAVSLESIQGSAARFLLVARAEADGSVQVVPVQVPLGDGGTLEEGTAVAWPGIGTGPGEVALRVHRPDPETVEVLLLHTEGSAAAEPVRMVGVRLCAAE